MTEHSIKYWNKQNEKIGKKEIRHNLFRYNSEVEKWLNQHGGRTLQDLFYEPERKNPDGTMKQRKYVVMDNRKVYLPVV